MLSVAFCIICLGVYILTNAYSLKYDVKVDRINFLLWLKDRDTIKDA